MGAPAHGSGIVASDPISVMLVGDSPVVRSAFEQVLQSAGFAVVAGVANVVEAISAVRSTRVDAILISAVTGPGGSMDTVEILCCHPSVAILVLSRSGTVRAAQDSVEAGARGYLVLDDAKEADLVEAVCTVAAGGMYEGPSIPSMPTAARPWRTRDGGLGKITERERQVLTLVAGGRSNREVAAMLGLSANTVAVHRKKVMRTFAVRKSAALVLLAVRHGLVSLDGVRSRE
jgi:DNA-binding NarL/FixJ family response regulator